MEPHRRTVSYLHYVIGSAVALAALLLTIVVPPFQKPDEEAHFLRTLSIVHGHVLCKGDSPNRILLDKGTQTFMTEVKKLGLANHPERKFNIDLYNRPVFATSAERQHTPFVIPAVYCGFPTVPYVPQVLGLWLGQTVGLNAFLAFFTGRMVMTVLAIAWMWWIYKRTPEWYRGGMLFMFSLPMFLHQLGTYSYDPVHLLLGCSLFAVTTSYRKTDRTLLWTVFLGLLLSRSGGYELLLLTYFLVPRRLLSETVRGYITKTLIFFVTLFAVFGIVKVMELQAMAAGATLGNGVSPTGQISYLAGSPIRFAIMAAKTTWHFAVFYLQSLIGILGWLEYGFPHSIYFVYCIAFMYLAITVRIPRDRMLPPRKLGLLACIIAGSYLYIMTIFYLLWNPVGASITDGLQGRYFLVFVPFAYVLLANVTSRALPSLGDRMRIPSWMTALLVVAVTVTCIYSVISRYYF